MKKIAIHARNAGGDKADDVPRKAVHSYARNAVRRLFSRQKNRAKMESFDFGMGVWGLWVGRGEGEGRERGCGSAPTCNFSP